MNPRINRPLRILLFVEADQALARATQLGLEATGLRVILSERYTEIVDWVFDHRDYPPDAVVLDFPITNGEEPRAFDLYRLVRHGASLAHRAQHFAGWGLQLPVIVLIPEQNRSQTERMLINQYAIYAQFVHKPFAPDLLASRIHSLLALITPALSAAERQRQPLETLILDSLIIDLARKRVLIDGQEVHFSETEYNVLCYLASHHDTIVSRRTLLAEVWHKTRPTSAETRYPDEYVKRIKQKLKNSSCAQMIDTKYGEGYVLRTTKPLRAEGEARVDVTQPVIGNTAEAQRQGYLVLVDGGANHTHLQATSGEFALTINDTNGLKVGRDPKQVHCIIDDSGEHFRRVSRLHAVILERDGELYIRDEHSSGGTTIARRNNVGIIERLRVLPGQEVSLQHNDLIHFNVVVYRFEFRFR
jgi:DNA-binding response OmpR family regulator